ncbi:MAG TPA: MFS transporter [Hellea balneolensis]|uniref:MFS transporter n=1 Tax=Hellea balneolensis TaxID=287478 RepID=A0A7C3G4E6_9PROT|nr:MFS transporter [Hellea balneolensis]
MSASPDMTSQQKIGILAAIMCTGSIALAWGLSSPLISQNLERMTGSGVLLGWLISLAAVATIVATPFVPKLLSRFSGRSVLVVCLIIGTLTIPALKIFMHPVAWFGIKFVASCAFTVVFVIAEIWINQLAPQHLRGRIFGIYGAALAGGMGIGSGLAVLTGIDGWMPFLVCTGINAMALIPVLAFSKATKIEQPPKDDAQFSAIVTIFKAAPAIMACAIVFGAIEQSLMYFLPVYDTRLGHSEYTARVLLLVAAVGNFLFQIPMGMLADKMNRGHLMIALMVVASVGPLLMAYVGLNFAALASLAFLYVGLTTALYTVGLVSLGERFKGHTLSAANAAFIMSYGVGSLVIPPVAGKMMDIFGPPGFMWAMAALGGMGLCVVSVRRLHRRS